MSAVSSINTPSSSDTTTNPNSTLTQSDYLQLLVTQMTSQDPLNPQSDTEFAAQLAQFSSLQESTAMAGNMSALQASTLIGSTVQVKDATDATKTSSGVVDGVDMSSGTPEIDVNGTLYGLSQIVTITPTQASAAAAQAAASTTPVATKP
jgi:flagellar basal-body rod modification protein FlgD